MPALHRASVEQLISMTSLRDEQGKLNIPVVYWVAFPKSVNPSSNPKGWEKSWLLKEVLFREDLLD